VKESTGKHSAKHGNKASEVEADRVTIQFGPEVRVNLAMLEQAVRGKKDFNSDVFFLLERLASGEALGMKQALANLLLVTQETAEYTARTGDIEAGSALNRVIAHVMGQSHDAKPITLMVEPKAKGR
jgi:hypothetical protein